MANPYSVTINSIATDGTNTYVNFSIFDGVHTTPQLQVTFPAAATATTINNYFQAVANAQAALPASLGVLVSTIIQGV